MSLAELDEFRFGEQRRVAQKASMDRSIKIMKDQDRRWALENDKQTRNRLLWMFGYVIIVISIGIAAYW